MLGRPSNEPNQPRPPTVEAALSESGRPVLLVPPTPPGTLGTTAVIACNRSTETARTVALAMPLLARAQRVVVVDFEDWGVSGPSAQNLARTLGRNGLPVEPRTVPNPHGHAGEVILAADEAMIAMVVEDMVVDFGSEVVGPVARLSEAISLAQIAELDAAILDINVGGSVVFPVADILKKRDIPFIFATGYGSKGLPDRFRSSHTLPKPFS